MVGCGEPDAKQLIVVVPLIGKAASLGGIVITGGTEYEQNNVCTIDTIVA